MGITPEKILAAISAFILLSNATKEVIRIWKTAKAPNAKQDERLSALEKWKDSVDAKLSRDNLRLQEIEKGDRATQRALLALLDHGIDGNNLKQMQDAKEELQNHLINR